MLHLLYIVQKYLDVTFTLHSSEIDVTFTLHSSEIDVTFTLHSLEIFRCYIYFT